MLISRVSVSLPCPKPRSPLRAPQPSPSPAAVGSPLRSSFLLGQPSGQVLGDWQVPDKLRTRNEGEGGMAISSAPLALDRQSCERLGLCSSKQDTDRQTCSICTLIPLPGRNSGWKLPFPQLRGIDCRHIMLLVLSLEMVTRPFLEPGWHLHLMY